MKELLVLFLGSVMMFTLGAFFGYRWAIIKVEELLEPLELKWSPVSSGTTSADEPTSEDHP